MKKNMKANFNWLNKLLNSSHIGVLVVDKNRKNLFVNERLCEISGYTQNELLEHSAELFHVNQTTFLNFAELAFKSALDGKVVDLDYQFKKKDGTLYWAHISGEVVQGQEEVLWTLVDITQEYELSQELESSYKLLSKLTTKIPGMTYQYQQRPDGTSCFPYASKGIEDIYEVKPQDVEKNAQPVFDILHPDDLSIISESIQESAETMNDWNIKYRVDLPKKGVCWLEGYAKPEALEDGSILWHGYIHDITGRVKKEDTINSQHKYLQSIIDAVEDPIMVIREDYTIELMNSVSYEKMQYMNIEDRANPKCYEISHNRSTPCDGHEHPCPLKEVLETKKYTKVIHDHSKEDGRKQYVELAASPLFDENHDCIGIIEAARDITQHLENQEKLKEQASDLHFQATHDDLTGLANRVLFHDRLQSSIKKAQRNNSIVALLFIDLDHFKEINDSLGHSAGDIVLKEVTKRFHNVVRDKDAVARLGGDEFTIIIEDLHQAQDASFVAQNLLSSLAEPMDLGGNTVYISSSIGISVYPSDGNSSQNLLKFADSAMYKAKEEGRNNYQFYSSEMTELAFERVVMEASLRAAIKNEELVVYYQPQINGKTHEVIGMEALVRWQHSTMGLVSPAKFIPLAESTGLIVDIDRFVMKTAMTQIVDWYEKGLNPGIMAINLAVKQFQQDDCIEILKKLLGETACKAEWLELEVTESQVMKKPENAIKLLDKISDLGIELAVDDFGTGYSSLAYLKKLPIDKLKIDQEFVKDLPSDEEDAAIAKAVIALAKSLNLRVIAEGVETKEQRDFLVANNCDNIQGYFYSRPIPADEFEVFLRKKIDDR
ncbi:EAL domain-containing protein [Sulfurimonas sp.]|nr:EAL domain-containing protein [Sulfurimonas sp.]